MIRLIKPRNPVDLFFRRVAIVLLYPGLLLIIAAECIYRGACTMYETAEEQIGEMNDFYKDAFRPRKVDEPENPEDYWSAQ